MSPPHPGAVVSAGRVITPDTELRPGWVQVVGHRVHAVGAGPSPVTGVTDHPDAVLVPGFVDTHAHGGGGASFGTGPEPALQAVRTHRAAGTTTLVASLVTAGLDGLARQLAGLRELVEQGDLAGLHLEGPWLSPRYRGAHDPVLLRVPAPAEVERLLTVAAGAVRMVTLAPELEHGLDAVRRVVGHGAVAAVGHTAADHATTRAAVEAGARVATHLFNAMPPLHHRTPGPVLALLADPRVAVELVADGVHLAPEIVAFAARTAAGGVHLVSDALAAAGAGDGEFSVGALPVTVHRGVARLTGTTTIAGSTLTLATAVRQAVEAGVSVQQAVLAATAAPARRLGLTGVGELAAGRSADLVLLGPDLRVRRVMRRGEWLGPLPGTGHDRATT